LADGALADAVGLADVLGLADAVGLEDELGLGDELELADGIGLADEVGLADGTEAVSTGTGTPRPRLTLRAGRWFLAAPDPLSGLRTVAWRKGFSGF
jgi:hypothetical protein